MLVTTVSYPVIQDEELMGVAAVSVPVTELAQLVHTVNVRYVTLLDDKPDLHIAYSCRNSSICDLILSDVQEIL